MASSALRIDADDFISPGLECIKEPDQTETGQKVEISLDDCLACSGCITSAEEIMLQQHNIDEILNFLEENKKKLENAKAIVVAGISSQSLASLCVESGESVGDFQNRIWSALRNNGVDYIFDYSLATAVALNSTFEKFMENEVENQKSWSKQKPLICSACPGWVVYAEKTHGELVSEYLSKIKSPQQILGRKIKKYFSTTKNFATQKVYHFSVMPCFDKKLEAARKANRISEEEPEVDVVISTDEFRKLIEKLSDSDDGMEIVSEHQANFYDTIPSGTNLFKTTNLPNQSASQFYGSDSYLNYIYRRLENYYNLEHVPEIIFQKYRNRNKDFNICELTIPGNVPGNTGNDTRTLKFAAVYGFKSIQQLIRLIKTNKCDYNYIEIMACPSGCLNGGGQIKYTGVSRDVQLEKLAQVEKLFLENGLLSWPEIESIREVSAGLEEDDYQTYFTDPKKKVEDSGQAAVGQNLILLGSNW